MSIQQKLFKIQKAIKAPKSQFNKFGHYYYRNCEDIFEATKPHLDDCTVTITDEIVLIGNRFYVKATATISDHEGSISVSAYAREADSKKGMDESQITGASSSYARKYALNGLFLIDDTKDADSTNKHGKVETDAPQEKDVPDFEAPEVTPQRYDEPPKINEDEVLVKIAKVESKKGETNGHEWVAYFIHTETGSSYGTFSHTIADMARSFKKEGKLIRLKWKAGKKEGSKEVVELSDDAA